ncbi:MAG TPA: cell envelope integrity protein TolA [Syntrophorhabdaceae bacterium]|nr:cell envelope integrity protein TolA [Syntrophorhabdaceae bacterium]HNT69481.1 cell envelope integrity protein TolA [Syntrophorhabdaceae bacterium]
MMREEAWYKMLIISCAIHVFVIAAFSIPFKKSSKRFDALSSYSVNLVGQLGGGGGSTGAAKAEKSPPGAKPVPAAPARVKKHAPIKKPAKEEVSLSKKKVAAREKTTKEELSRLEERIRDMKKRADYLDVSKTKAAGAGGQGGAGAGAPGLPFGSEGGGKPLDPAMQKYILDIWDKVKSAWGVPGMTYKKDLETIVIIRIRKDGRIVDISIEKRSGNRIYDESILRVLRAVDPLPPIPPSLNTDSMELGFRFLPGDLS